jgi:SAM-dependent methyltransferase
MKPRSLTLDDERPRPDGPDRVSYHHHLARYRFAYRNMAGRERVLDAGCGTGYGSRLLREKALSVVGIDNSPLAVDYATKNFSAPGVVFARMDCQHLAFPGSSFELVVCFEVFEHLESHDEFLRECLRVLGARGTLILSTPNVATTDLHMKSIGQSNPFHISMLDLSGFRRVLSRHFREVEVFGQRRRGNRLYAALRAVDVFNLRLRVLPNDQRERLQQALDVPVGEAALPDNWIIERSQLRQANQFVAICRK